MLTTYLISTQQKVMKDILGDSLLDTMGIYLVRITKSSDISALIKCISPNLLNAKLFIRNLFFIKSGSFSQRLEGNPSPVRHVHTVFHLVLYYSDAVDSKICLKVWSFNFSIPFYPWCDQLMPSHFHNSHDALWHIL